MRRSSHPSSSRPSSGPLVRVLVALAALLVALQIVLDVRVALSDEWSEIRLAPTIAMLHGVPLWEPYGEGPILDTIYGPVAPITWLPAGLGSTPTQAIAIAAIQSLILLMAPVAWIVYLEARRQPTLLFAILGLGLALLLSSSALPSVGIHADFPALAFATAAIGCAWTGQRRRSAAWRWAGAIFVIASIGAKQTMVPLVVAYPLWIGIASGWSVARQALIALGVVGAAAAGLVILAFDERAMIDAAIVGVSRHPFAGASASEALMAAAMNLVRRSAPFVVLLAIAGSAVRRDADSWRDAARKHRWLFPLVVGVFCVPTSILGDAKVGGAENALAFTIWFVWLALLGALASAGRADRKVFRRLTLGTAIVACLLAVRLAPDLADLPRLFRERPWSAVAFESARQAPNAIYFPYNPLATLYADGRAYHLDPGLQFREIERRRVDEQLVREHVPAGLDRVAANRQVMPRVLNYLPRFRRQVLDPTLPGWIVFTESDVLDDGERPGPVTAGGALPVAIPAAVVRLPSRGVTVDTAEVTVPDQSRRPVVRLSATLEATAGQDGVEVETLLYDAAGRYLVSLVASGVSAGTGAIETAWPVYADLLRSAADAVVLVRAGRSAGQEQWRLSPEQVRALARQALAAK